MSAGFGYCLATDIDDPDQSQLLYCSHDSVSGMEERVWAYNWCPTKYSALPIVGIVVYLCAFAIGWKSMFIMALFVIKPPTKTDLPSTRQELTRTQEFYDMNSRRRCLASVSEIIYIVVVLTASPVVTNLYFVNEQQRNSSDTYLEPPVIRTKMSKLRVEMANRCDSSRLNYALCFGMGPMPWLINTEIYPQWARSTCIGCATATNWLFNLFISISFLSLSEAITTQGAMFLYAAFTAVGFIVFYIFLPETKGYSLEEVEYLFLVPLHRNWRTQGHVGTKPQAAVGDEAETENYGALSDQQQS